MTNPEAATARSTHCSIVSWTTGASSAPSSSSIRDGRPFYSKAVGYADREAGTPMTMETVFRLASMTKPIVSVATLALAEAGLFDLDDAVRPSCRSLRRTGPVGEEADHHHPPPSHPYRGPLLWLPAGRRRRLSAGRHFGRDRPARHHSGGEPGRLASMPLRFSPGSAWHYSLATDVLGAVLRPPPGRPCRRS